MQKKRRIEIIDISKAITIFFVIMGHTTSNLDTSLFRRTIYSFHMPLFFMLAGFSIKPHRVTSKKEMLAFIKKNVTALIVPYFIWGLIYGTFSYHSLKYLAFGSWEALVEIGTLTSLWYLPCFFIARIIAQVETNIILKFAESRKKELLTIMGAITAIIGYIIPHPEGGVLWCADIAVLAAGFILFGMGIRELYITIGQQKNIVLALSFIISLGLFILCTYGRADDLYLSLICSSDNGNMFWFFLDALLGSVAVLSLSWIIFRLSRESAVKFSTKIITSIGTHTMGIYILHKPFLQEVLVPLVSNVLNGCAFELIAFVASILALIYSMILCMIIEKFIPQLLGQFPKY